MRYQQKQAPQPPPKPKPSIAPFPSPLKVRVIANPSYYNGFEGEAIGRCEGLLVVPLPATGERIAYQGLFRDDYVEFLDTPQEEDCEW